MRNYANVVYVLDEGVYGIIVGGLQAFYTTVRYAKDGFEYEVALEQDEFELMEEDWEIDNDD
jgi:hypothetical protein